ncbi:glycine betaine ABC transporter substrate-binding protein [Leucobacter massiliensis]|uniref:Glycine/betaine ABC transporter substrate-binding protein n=1 Tax=Leucobacter massiliensis TaxID=1686285 RepID=A0A2S9QR89_9MICO|nr:glycine betaine ABC transporter substrate-binding protein [Leucobacter massiliensis]PRI12101.1 glycine/betaine ABC transporter substrate-binding protein [Leucobacter massiliensis]
MHQRTLTGLLALGAAAALALTGCSNSGDANGENGENGGDKGTVTLGYLPAWTDGLSTAYLLEDQLGKMGYTVEMEELTEAGVLYAGLAGGDFDIYPSAWPEVTHADYMKQFGDSIEDLGGYYDGAVLTLAVPEYVDIDSIEDLAGAADRFDGQIIGIEPGAGLTRQTQEVAMPEYGLDGDYELVTSSTATMLATLQDKIDREEDVVVTLWRPFWANDAFPLKDLKDPRGAMGEPETLHFLAKQGFSDEMPEVAEYIAQIKLDDEAYGALESLVTGDEYANDPQGAVDAWLKEYGDAYPGLITD